MSSVQDEVERRRKSMGLTVQRLTSLAGLTPTILTDNTASGTDWYVRTLRKLAAVLGSFQVGEGAASEEGTKGLSVGEEILRRRRGRKLSIRELSRQTGVAVGAICYYERGKHEPRVETLEMLAKVLGPFIITSEFRTERSVFKTKCDDCGEALVVRTIKLRHGVPLNREGGFFIEELDNEDVNWDHCELSCCGCGKDYGRVYSVEVFEDG